MKHRKDRELNAYLAGGEHTQPQEDARFQAIRDLHREQEVTRAYDTVRFCTHCNYKAPCPTRQIIDGEEADE